MMEETGIYLKLSGMVGLTAVIIVLGIILHKGGEPYNAIIFNFHKFLSIGLAITGYFLFKGIGGHFWIDRRVLFLFVICIFFILTLFVSGGLLSAGKGSKTMLINMHKIATTGTVICLFVLFYVAFFQS